MPYKDITYDNGFTERFYFDETAEDEAFRISRANHVAQFPSADHRAASVRNAILKGQEPSLRESG
ncbi:hypothetical protein OAI19_01595 [Porticoccaceae bacterium]|nr:hypothetical protein [Porticoccaceae bacterium]